MTGNAEMFTVTIIARGDGENTSEEAIHHGLSAAQKSGFIEAWTDAEPVRKFTSIPEIDGLFWYYEIGAAEPRPVMINSSKWGKKLKSFNGSEQSWLREGEYLLGPQAAPEPMS